MTSQSHLVMSHAREPNSPPIKGPGKCACRKIQISEARPKWAEPLSEPSVGLVRPPLHSTPITHTRMGALSRSPPERRKTRTHPRGENWGRGPCGESAQTAYNQAPADGRPLLLEPHRPKHLRAPPSSASLHHGRSGDCGCQHHRECRNGDTTRQPGIIHGRLRAQAGRINESVCKL